MLSTSLRGVISQQLLQKADKSGRVAALEILVNTGGVEPDPPGQARPARDHHAIGQPVRACTMDSAIEQLLKDRMVTGKEAYKKGTSKSKFEPVKDMDPAG